MTAAPSTFGPDGAGAPAARARLDAAGLAALVRPRIAVLVLVETTAGFLLARPASLAPLPWVLLGTALVAAAGCALNHYLERDADARMPRTRRRPLVTGALTARQVLTGGLAALLGGLALTAARGGIAAAGLLALSAAIYLALYTPLKRRTSVNTWIGALTGALPVLVGAAAARTGALELPLMVFLLVLLWQLPHFFAIASMYRDEYRTGGMRMLSDDDPDDALLRWQMPVQVMSVVLVSMLPVLAGPARQGYLACALLLGALFLHRALSFRRSPVAAQARRVVVASVVYLPLLLVALVADVSCSGATGPEPGGPLAAACEACPDDHAAGTTQHAGSEAARGPGPDGAGAAAAPVLSDPLAGGGAASLPEFELVDQDGRAFTRGDMQGSVWVVDFIFTRCAGICVPMTRALVDMQEEELPVRYLSISVDPERDSPPVLAAYRAKWDGDVDRWTLATGSHEAVLRLAEDGFKLPVSTRSRAAADAPPAGGTDGGAGPAAADDREAGDDRGPDAAVEAAGDAHDAEVAPTPVGGMPGLFHSGRFALVDRDGRVHGYYAHDDRLELERLRADARRLAGAP